MRFDYTRCYVGACSFEIKNIALRWIYFVNIVSFWDDYYE